MTDTENPDSPVFIWTFPLITRMQNRSGLIDFGQQASTISDSVQDARDSKPVRSSITDKLSNNDSNNTESEEIEELQNEVQEVEENGESIFDDFSSDYNQAESQSVEILDDVFAPLRIKVDGGDTVEWTNNDDTAHRIMSTSGEEISSDQIEPGETFTHTFDESGVTRYIDSLVGGDVMCGAVIVGDAELDEPLQCEEDVERELFEEETDEQDGEVRSMSAAAEEKDNMEIGFNA